MITQDYNLNTTNQLIDINDVHTSFTTLMSVTCENLQDTFEYAIINQKTLDSNRINFKKVVGSWEDSFTINQENFQNWYLVLKSDKDTKCTVNLNITPLDYNTEPPQQPDTAVLSQVRPQPKNSVRSSLQPPNPQMQQRAAPFQQRRPAPRPIQRQAPFRRPPVQEMYGDDDDEYFEEEEDDDDDCTSSAPPTVVTGWARYYKCIAYSLVGIIVLLVILWWTGYIHSVPFFNRFFKKPIDGVTAPQAFGGMTSMVPNATSYFTSPPPPHFQPVHAPPVVEAPPTPDTNFINEMRELKIDL